MEELVKHSVEKLRIIWSHFTRTLFHEPVKIPTLTHAITHHISCPVCHIFFLIQDNSHSV